MTEPSDKDDTKREDAYLSSTAAPTTSNPLRKALVRLQTQPTKSDPGPPPDGGIIAWLQVLGAHFTFCNTWATPPLSACFSHTMSRFSHSRHLPFHGSEAFRSSFYSP